jgi:predicted DNA-binding antitoxin AbrB/MazE fold protein
MGREIEVIYENGVFWPTVPVRLAEGDRLKLYIPFEPHGLTPEQMEEELRKMREAFADWNEQDWAEFEATFKRGT